MRKIYPLPFNKFTIVIFYCLLSIAAITLAQNGKTLSNNCGLSPAKSGGYITMGYINLSDGPDNIKWELYDYINVIAYPNGGPWNSLFKGPESGTQIDKFIKSKKSNTKILLSIRNYDPFVWPIPEDDNDKDIYERIVTETVEALITLDGVDIEYPGMRGSYCGDWGVGKGKEKNDVDFVNFLGQLREQMPKEKTLMVTVGKDTLTGKTVPGLNKHINYLNIETHHHSIYTNLKSPQIPNTINSYPNSPLPDFQSAYDAWIGTGIDKEKIIMGVDFGNTFQVVSNPAIANSPSVPTEPLDKFDSGKEPVIDKLKSINNLCSASPLDGKLHLYSFPWKDLSTNVLDQNNCNKTKTTQSDWTYQTDQISFTPWLYRKAPDQDQEIYHYVSFEDFTSLKLKLDYVIEKQAKGISISDISYDDDNGSLSNFVHGKIDLNIPIGAPSPGSGKGKAPLETSTSSGSSGSENPQIDDKNKTGAIVGSVIGSLAIVTLGACLFFLYRRRGRPKSSSFKSLLAFPSSIRNHATSRNTEMTSDVTNRYGPPPTTVIPVASGYVTAMFDFTGKEENDLSFKKGDKIEVLERGDGPNDWWVGRVNGAVGEFPGNYVKET